MEVNSEAFTNFISRLSGVEHRDGYSVAQCPAHDDSEASLSITTRDDGSVLIKCHAGCPTPTIVQCAGMSMHELFVDHGRKPGEWNKHKKKGKLVATYDYHDADNALVYQSLRYESIVEGKKKKTFEQRRPNGKGGWLYNMKGVSKVLYRLPEIIAARNETVLVVEGEKDADNLVALGFIATCNVAGAGKWLQAYSDQLKGRDVVIIPDNDAPGRDHAAKVIASLEGVAKSITILELPGLKEKGDATDWINAGGTKSQLLELIQSARLGELFDFGDSSGESEVKEPESPDDLIAVERQRCELMGLDVFGELENGRVKIFSYAHRKTEIIRDVSKLSFQDLLRICGPKIKQTVFTGKAEDKQDDGQITIKEARDAIAVMAGFKRLTDQSDLGLGVWSATTDDAHKAMILVGAGECVVVNGSCDRHTLPRLGDQLLDLNSSEDWFSFDELSRLFRAYSPEWAKAVVSEAEGMFSQWKYRDDEMPRIITGLVMATWVQTCWKWRPQVSIRGQSDSGKTTMLEVLSGAENRLGIFGKLAIKSSQSSAAGVRQAIRNTGRVVICDELEAGRHRTDILEMLRGSGRGDKTLRGSTTHKATEFRLQHIVWTAAIESGLKAEADKNRFIAIELLRPPEHEMGRLRIPDEEGLRSLGAKLLIVAVKQFERSRQLIDEMLKQRPHGYHNRLIESYAVPAAMYSLAVHGDNIEAAVGTLYQFLLSTEYEDEDGDSEQVLQAILESDVTFSQGQRITVAELLSDGDYNPERDAYSSMLSCGVGVVFPPTANNEDKTQWVEGEKKCLFINCAAVQRKLLRGTDWEGKNVAELLIRLPKAMKSRKRLPAQNQSRGIIVPMSYLEKILGKAETL